MDTLNGVCVERVSVQNLRRLASDRARFEALFSGRERRRMHQRAKPFEGLAARLAAKRALHRLFRSRHVFHPFVYHAVEVRNRATGEPFFYFRLAKMRSMMKVKIGPCLLSLSHTDSHGFAVVSALRGP